MPDKMSPRLKQQELVGYALSIAEYYGVKLNFSERSLKKVDTILDEVRKEYSPAADSSDDVKEAMNGIGLEMGAYVIETIERANGKGEWERDDPDIGKETWPFTYGNATIFPVEWCLKRIYSAKEKGVTYKYKQLFLAQAKRVM